MYQDILTYNANSTSELLSIVSNQLPFLFPLILFCVFLLVLMGSYFAQSRIKGFGDILSSFAVSGIFIGILAVFMLLVNPPILDIFSGVICIVLAIIGFFIIINDL
jgi:hypothetical protein